MPNAPLDLDPSLQDLLKSADMTMAHRTNTHNPKPSHRDMELIEQEGKTSTNWIEEEDFGARGSRKSPAAEFGSRNIGAVVLPDQLQESVTRLIESAFIPHPCFFRAKTYLDSDKSMLRVDAKRIFGTTDDTDDHKWDSQYDVKYKSNKQAYRHSERDGTAFASIALPAHFSAIYSVFDHVKRRRGSEWQVERVIDWCAGTGSGLWLVVVFVRRLLLIWIFRASACSFQNAHRADMEKLSLGDSKIQSYLGIDKRDGLVAIAKRLLQSEFPLPHTIHPFSCCADVRRNDMVISWQKSFHEDDRIPRSQGHDVLALSAFSLSSLPTPLSRKALVKEMWESGAHTIVRGHHLFTRLVG